MQNLLKNRIFFETTLVVLTTLVFSLGVGFLGAVAVKYQLALAIGLAGALVICLVPQRRTLCLVLWILTQPLSIEKILYTAPGLWSDLRGQEIVLNAADIILVLLAGIIAFEKFILRKPILLWDSKAKWFLALICWATVSYLIHRLYLHSSFINSTPIGLLHLIRLLLFVIVIQAAIQTRGDLLWALLAVMLVLFSQSALVLLSYATGEVYNFSRLLGQVSEVQSYSGAGGAITRGTGTLGVANQQALFHTMFTFLLVGLLAVKRLLFSILAMLLILFSFIAVIFTFARTAWFSIALASLLAITVFIYRGKFTSKTWLIGGILTIALSILLALVAQPIYDRLSSGDNGATDSRVRMAYLAKDLFLQYPLFGVGQAEYVEAGLALYPPGYKEPEWVALGDEPIVPPLGRIELATAFVNGEKIEVPLSVHNKYLLVLSELGAVGLLIWLVFFYQFFKDARNCARSKDVLYEFIGIAGFSILLAASIYMMLDLFADEKTIEILLFPLLIVSATKRLSAQSG